MAVAQPRVRLPPGVPQPGVYFTDADAINLYRCESVHRREGMVYENCRTLELDMLTFKEFLDGGYKEI